MANSQAFPYGGETMSILKITDGSSNTIFFTEGYYRCYGVAASTFTGSSFSYTPQPYLRENDWNQEYGPTFYGSENFNSKNNTQTWNTFDVRPNPNKCHPDLPNSPYSGGILVGLGDGSVRMVSSGVSGNTWYAAQTTNQGDILGSDW
jgi:hypothetical protein